MLAIGRSWKFQKVSIPWKNLQDKICQTVKLHFSFFMLLFFFFVINQNLNFIFVPELNQNTEFCQKNPSPARTNRTSATWDLRSSIPPSNTTSILPSRLSPKIHFSSTSDQRMKSTRVSTLSRPCIYRPSLIQVIEFPWVIEHFNLQFQRQSQLEIIRKEPTKLSFLWWIGFRQRERL